MASTLDLRASIREKLLTKCSTVFYERANENQAGPYVVFNLDTGNYDELCIQVQLEVYVVGYGTDTSTVENLADSIWDLLNHVAVCSGDLGYTVYPSVRNNLTEEDKNIIERRLVFTVKQFIGGY